MAVIRWEPFGDLERFFQDFQAPFPTGMGWDLAVDVFEEKGNVIAEMNLPGIDPGKVSVSVEDSYLRISGTRSEEKEEKKKHYYSKEIRRGSFERVVRLPQPVESGKVKADYERGVLRVTISLARSAKTERVKVNVKGK